jgi:phosphotransferase system HPr (HPr) family protein
MTFSITHELTLKIPQGLHTRPSGKLGSLIKEYGVECHIIYNNRRVNASSILDLITLMIPYDAKITLEVTGKNADDFLKRALVLLG